MVIKNKYFGFLLVILAMDLTADNLKIPKILIIGDSISLGYTPMIKEYFGDKARISHNPGNAGDTSRGLENIKEWVGDEDWDIIQFNWGLWDLCYRSPESKLYGNRDKVNGEITFSIDEYKANLDSIVTILKKISDAKLIFVTTTYVPENEAGRYTKDVEKYNAAGKDIMKKHSVLINDIYETSIAIHKKNGLGSDDVHYTDS